MTTQQLHASSTIGEGFEHGEISSKQKFKFDYIMCPAYKQYVAPILRKKRSNLLIFTISPDIKSLQDTIDLRDRYTELFYTNRVPFFSVSEVAHKSLRLHWHGVMLVPDVMFGTHHFRSEFVASMKAIPGAFVDVQKPRNLSNWVSYCMKEVKTGSEISNGLRFPKVGPNYLPDVKPSLEVNESDGDNFGDNFGDDLSWLIADYSGN